MWKKCGKMWKNVKNALVARFLYTTYIYILAPIWGSSGTRRPIIFWDMFLRYLRILFQPKKKKMIIMTKIGKKKEVGPLKKEGIVKKKKITMTQL